MDEHDVDIVGVQFLQRAFNGTHRIVIARIGVPYLGRDDNIGALNIGCFDGFADGFFVVVVGRRIEQAISCGECIRHGLFRFIDSSRPVRAEADRRDEAAVI